MSRILLLFFVVPVLFSSCKKEPVTIDQYFSEPILNWNYSKQDVLTEETRDLQGNYSAEDIVFILSPFVKGDGYLEYSDPKQYINIVSYGFYSELKTLVQVFMEFVSNSEIESELFSFMKSKYGKYYDESIRSDSKTYTWNKPGMIVTMEKESHGLYVRYVKDPL